MRYCPRAILSLWYGRGHQQNHGEKNDQQPAGSTACWKGSQVALVFRESGHYPVQPEHMQVKRNGSDGVRASICEIAYQGVEVRMMLRNQADNEILEVRYRGNEDYQVGDEVTLTLCANCIFWM